MTGSLYSLKQNRRGGALTRPRILLYKIRRRKAKNPVILLRENQNSTNFGGRVDAPPLQNFSNGVFYTSRTGFSTRTTVAVPTMRSPSQMSMVLPGQRVWG